MYHFCAVRFCQPLSEIKGTTPIIKKIGDHFNMRCPFYPCIETAGNICNFTKVNENTGKPELVHQGRVLNITIAEFNDAGTYCYTPHCASNTESCCINIQGMQLHIILCINPVGYFITYLHKISFFIQSNQK